MKKVIRTESLGQKPVTEVESMLLGVYSEGYKCFTADGWFSLVGNKDDGRLKDNYYTTEFGDKALKSICVFGANNTGKTSLCEVFGIIRAVMLGERIKAIEYNCYIGNPEVTFAVDFIYKHRQFRYWFTFDNNKPHGDANGFVYESLTENILKDGEIEMHEIFEKDMKHGSYLFPSNPKLEDMLKGASGCSTMLYQINPEVYPEIQEYKDIFRGFAETIDVIDLNNLSMDKTISACKKNGDPLKKCTLDLIKTANPDVSDVLVEIGTFYKDRLILVHGSRNDWYSCTTKGFYTDDESEGTRTFVALASYIADALQNGKVLIVDNFGDNWHTKLAREIILSFNSFLNEVGGQLVCTSHNLLLMEGDPLLRRDQIWFTVKDDETYYYPLSSFNRLDGTEDKDILDNYLRRNYVKYPVYDFSGIGFTKSQESKKNAKKE